MGNGFPGGGHLIAPHIKPKHLMLAPPSAAITWPAQRPPGWNDRK